MKGLLPLAQRKIDWIRLVLLLLVASSAGYCLFVFGTTLGFRRGESYASSLLSKDSELAAAFDMYLPITDDYSTAAAAYLFIAVCCSAIFVINLLALRSKARIVSAVPVLTILLLFLPVYRYLWLFQMKQPPRESESANPRFAMSLEAVPFDIAFSFALILVFLICIGLLLSNIRHTTRE